MRSVNIITLATTLTILVFLFTPSFAVTVPSSPSNKGKNHVADEFSKTQEKPELPPYSAKQIEYADIPDKSYLYEMQGSQGSEEFTGSSEYNAIMERVRSILNSGNSGNTTTSEIDDASSHVSTDSEVEDSALLWLNLLGKIYNVRRKIYFEKKTQIPITFIGRKFYLVTKVCKDDKGKKETASDKGKRDTVSDKGKKEIVGDKGKKETVGDKGKKETEEFKLNPAKPLFKLTYSNPKIWLHRRKETNQLEPSSYSGGSLVTPTRIAILASSFNPPTKAHLQLLVQSVIDANSGTLQGVLSTKDVPFFDACLLLFAVNNADKPTSSSNDVTNRLLMMEALAKHIVSTYPNEVKNIAVGVNTHGRFLDHARALLSFFYSSNILENSDLSNVSFYFIMGFDTVIRFFNPKYYLDMHKELQAFFETSNIICANRDGYGQEVEDFFKSETVAELLGKGKLIRIQLSQDIAEMSSTSIRKFIGEQCRNSDGDREEKIKRAVYEMCPEPVSEFVIEEGLYRN
ncbi:16573_t:CDS:2 [Acaulospora morrowiae]|uniref:16573_t:CDS:1 n=1 Tax=Acaulospora morrowiae TaxID=94023 RepID=A0A9N8WBK6_9GLOM|nr:16573_t:CDS:2 [Acaulospora morrowiae]